MQPTPTLLVEAPYVELEVHGSIRQLAICSVSWAQIAKARVRRGPGPRSPRPKRLSKWMLGPRIVMIGGSILGGGEDMSDSIWGRKSQCSIAVWRLERIEQEHRLVDRIY